MIRFYHKLPDMECLAGDTLPAFVVRIEGDEASNGTMKMILSRSDQPDTPVIIKECVYKADGFKVQLTNDDTSALSEHIYIICFVYRSDEGTEFRKAAGKIYIHASAQIKEGE